MFARFQKSQEPKGVLICKGNEMKDGEMKEVEVGKGKILVVRDAGQFYAIGSNCSHYAAPLIKGVVGNGHVRCPWHGACFSLKTGDIEDFPGIDSVPKYEVVVEKGEVRVLVTEETLQAARRRKALCRHAKQDKQTFVIAGGGPAAASCAETLRQEGFTGKIIVLTNESVVAYDRPKLSKALNMKAEEIAIRSLEFYSQCDVEYRFNSEVTKVDRAKNQVVLSNGDKVLYDKLLVATGAVPRQATFVKNHTLDNIYTLRTVKDANRISDMGKGKRVLIIGTSFIGLEVAVYLANKSASVTVIGRSGTVLLESLGTSVGSRLQQLLEEKGIKFYFKNSVSEFLGENEALKGAILQDGTQLEVDMCVVGIGVVPATDFLKDSGLGITDRGFLTVDKHMQTNVENIYAAGDVTHFPLFLADDQHVNIQHWQMALKQGKVAALNMLGKKEAIRSVPFFWTVMFGMSLRYCGYGVGYDDIVLHGDLKGLQFVAYYTKGEKVIAVASMNFDPIVAQVAEAFLAGKQISKEQVKSDPKGWMDTH